MEGVIVMVFVSYFAIKAMLLIIDCKYKVGKLFRQEEKTYSLVSSKGIERAVPIWKPHRRFGRGCQVWWQKEEGWGGQQGGAYTAHDKYPAYFFQLKSSNGNTYVELKCSDVEEDEEEERAEFLNNNKWEKKITVLWYISANLGNLAMKEATPAFES